MTPDWQDGIRLHVTAFTVARHPGLSAPGRAIPVPAGGGA